MLVLHEVHRVAGRHAEAFADLYRDGWAGLLLAAGDDARLLWFLEQAHGTGPSYTFVSADRRRDRSTALGRPPRPCAPRRPARGGRPRSTACGSTPRPRCWYRPRSRPSSRSTSTPCRCPPTPERGPDLGLFMEDTAWPHPGRLDDYLARAGSLYVETLARAAEHGRNLLELVAAFTPMFGAGSEREVVLWQRVAQPRAAVPAAQAGGAGRAPSARHLDARRPRGPRPMGEPAVAGRSVVAARLEIPTSWLSIPLPSTPAPTPTRPPSSTATPSRPTPSSTPS